MPLAARLFAVLAVAGAACAGTRGGPAPDAEAVREATRPDPPGRYHSSQAYAHYLRARQAEQEGDFRASAEELQQALAHDPQSAEIRLSLAEALARLAQLPRAEAEARRAVQADPAGSTEAGARLLLGKIAALDRRRDQAADELRAAIRLQKALAAGKTGDEAEVDAEPWRVLADLQLESGDEQGAARTLEDLAAVSPGQGAGFREMGRFYLEKRDVERAEKYLRKAVEKDRRDVEAWRRLAQLEESRQRTELARQAWEALLRAEPDDGEALLRLGKLALGSGDASAARAWFGQLVRGARDEGGARLSVALAWLDAHRPAEALAVAEEGLKSLPADGRLHYVQGLALQERKRWSEAAAAFAAVRTEEAELHATARLSLAYALSHAGRHEEALRILDAALEARSRDVRLLTMKSWVLDRAGRSPEAVAMLERALADRRGDPQGAEGEGELYEALATSLDKAGRGAEAIAVLKKAGTARPSDETVRYALGVAYEKAGDREAAVAAMQELLALNPDHPDALNFVGYSLAERGIRLDEAEKLVARALELRPGNGYFMDSLGWVYFQKGDFGRAVAILEKADAVSDGEPTILEHLGDAYRRAGRPADAEKAWRRALRALKQGAEPERPNQQASLERKVREVSSEIRPAKR
ncbi:MAG TPA: tetratricopeptide repeat protein [Anaeromyxobacteraceae bacterium]